MYALVAYLGPMKAWGEGTRLLEGLWGRALSTWSGGTVSYKSKEYWNYTAAKFTHSTHLEGLDH